MFAASMRPSLMAHSLSNTAVNSTCSTSSTEICFDCPKFVEDGVTDAATGSRVVCCSCGSRNARASDFDFFCVKCSALLPAEEDVSFFQLFGLPEQFSIHLKALEKRYRKIQMAVHPDKFHTCKAEQHDLAEQHSAMINTAYWTLRDPEQRAFYMLSRRGFDVDEETVTRGTPPDPAFLMEIMEMREDVEAAGPDTLPGMLEEVDATIRRTAEEVGAGLDGGQDQEAFMAAVRMRYYNQVRKEIYEMT